MARGALLPRYVRGRPAAPAGARSANNGMTIEMPGGYFYADFLSQAPANGTVSQATLDTMVSRVLTQMFAFGLFDKTKTGNRDAVVTTPAHQATATVTVADPHGMSGPAHTAVRLPVTAKSSAAGARLVLTATGLPKGLSIGASGVISGTPTAAGTSTVGVTASDGHGAADTATFVWTVT